MATALWLGRFIVAAAILIAVVLVVAMRWAPVTRPPVAVLPTVREPPAPTERDPEPDREREAVDELAACEKASSTWRSSITRP